MILNSIIDRDSLDLEHDRGYYLIVHEISAYKMVIQIHFLLEVGAVLASKSYAGSWRLKKKKREKSTL